LWFFASYLWRAVGRIVEIKVHTRLRCESRKERYGFEDPGVDTWEDNIKIDLKDEGI